MPYFALIIMFYHVKIACYQRCDECIVKGPTLLGPSWSNRLLLHSALILLVTVPPT